MDSNEEFTRWLAENRPELTRLPLNQALQKAWDEGERQPVLGNDVTEGAGPDATCGCGDPVTYYAGEWMHIYSEELRGTGDHNAEPGEPVNWAGYEEDCEECGRNIPVKDGGNLLNRHHDKSCSLYDPNED